MNECTFNVIRRVISLRTTIDVSFIIDDKVIGTCLKTMWTYHWNWLPPSPSPLPQIKFESNLGLMFCDFLSMFRTLQEFTYFVILQLNISKWWSLARFLQLRLKLIHVQNKESIVPINLGLKWKVKTYVFTVVTNHENF